MVPALSKYNAPLDYPRYLASREWALLKREVRRRSGGLCERCHFRPATETHHLTYARTGHEDLDDLQDVCRPCHAYESSLSTFDPLGCNCDPLTAREWANNLKGEPSYGVALRHLHDVEDAYCA